jgi:hypothetical protein
VAGIRCNRPIAASLIEESISTDMSASVLHLAGLALARILQFAKNGGPDGLLEIPPWYENGIMPNLRTLDGQVKSTGSSPTEKEPLSPGDRDLGEITMIGLLPSPSYSGTAP